MKVLPLPYKHVQLDLQNNGSDNHAEIAVPSLLVLLCWIHALVRIWLAAVTQRRLSHRWSLPFVTVSSGHLATKPSHHQLCQLFQSYSLVVSRLLGGEIVWCPSTIHSSVQLRETVLIFCALSLQCFFQGERGVFWRRAPLAKVILRFIVIYYVWTCCTRLYLPFLEN